MSRALHPEGGDPDHAPSPRPVRNHHGTPRVPSASVRGAATGADLVAADVDAGHFAVSIVTGVDVDHIDGRLGARMVMSEVR